MSSEEYVPVLIVGGGIVGLSASLFLSHHGIKSRVIERHSGTSIHPRSRSVNSRTMEIFRGLGIEDRIREAGASLSGSMGIYSGNSLREVIEAHPRKEGRKIPLTGLLSSISPVTGTFVTQDMIEPVLVDVAMERGGSVLFNVECLDVQQNDDGVIATIKDRITGTESIIRADYLIAADGAGSPLRNHLEIPTTGRGTMGHLLNILFHADLKFLVDKREFSLCRIERPEVSGLFTAINNNDRWVFHMLYDPSAGESPSDFTTERCKGLLRIATGFPELEIEIKSIMPWEPSVRIAERLRDDRIFLAGDAAHQMPPWAGQGANSGIADVHNLAWKLSMVIKRHANQALLDTYGIERIPIGRTAAEVSAEAADERGVISTNKDLKLIRRLLKSIHIMSGHGYCYESAAICTEDTSPLGGLTWKPWTLPSLFMSWDGRPGSRVPHLFVEHQGKRVSTLDLCGNGFVLLAGADGVLWLEAAKQIAADFKLDIGAYRLGPEGDLKTTKGRFESAAGIYPQGALLIRPDHFIVWRQRRGSTDCQFELRQAMEQALCLQEHE